MLGLLQAFRASGPNKILINRVKTSCRVKDHSRMIKEKEALLRVKTENDSDVICCIYFVFAINLYFIIYSLTKTI